MGFQLNASYQITAKPDSTNGSNLKIMKFPTASCGVSGVDETIRLTGVRRKGGTPHEVGYILVVI